MGFLDKIDLSNSYIVLGLMVVILFMALLIFVPSTEASPKHKTVLKILIYFALPSLVLMDSHNSTLRNIYMNDHEEKKAEDVFSEIMYTPTGGAEDVGFMNTIYK